MCLHTKWKNQGSEEQFESEVWTCSIIAINFIMAGDFPSPKIQKNLYHPLTTCRQRRLQPFTEKRHNNINEHLSLARIKIQNNKYFFISWHNFSLVRFCVVPDSVYRWKLLCVIFVVFGNAMHDLWSPGKLSKKENYKFTARKCITSQRV